MKYKTAIVAVSLLMASVLLIGGARLLSKRPASAEKQNIAVSFYPMYVAAQNLTKGIDALQVTNLTEGQNGCVHDFTLRPQDMVTLEHASAFLINGGGMESFLHTVTDAYPALVIVDSSTGMEALCSNADHTQDHDHAHDHTHGAEEAINAHFWLSPTCHIQQIENLCKGLTDAFPQYRKQIEQNAADYTEKLNALQTALHTATAAFQDTKVVILHDAFAYLAMDCGLHVAAAVQVERDTALSAAEIAEVIDIVRESGASIILAEPEYSPELAAALARETNAKAFTLDTCVNGPNNADAYLNAMYHNISILTDALAG